MSDKIQYAAIDRIDNKLDEIEVLLDQAPLLQDDKNELINSIYEFYCDLEKAVDRYHEEWEFDQETISPPIPNLDQDDDNALMEEL